MLVIGRSYWVVPIQDEDVKTEAGIKLAEDTTEKSAGTEAEREGETKAGAETGVETGSFAATNLIARGTKGGATKLTEGIME